jgi:spore coat protein U-like protein
MFALHVANRLCWLVAISLFGWSPPVAAQSTFGTCTISTPALNLGSVSSFAVASQAQATSGSGGLACTSLAAFNTSYVKIQIDSSTFLLTGGPSGQVIPFAISTSSGGTPLHQGDSVDLSTNQVLNLFSNAGNSIPLFVTTAPTGGLRAGTYRGTVSVRWYFSICSFGIAGVCAFSESPNIIRPSVFNGETLTWGDGTPTIVNITLVVQNDCVINAPNLNFGTAPFVTGFNPVTQTININCSAGQPYSVGLDDGGHFSGGSRRMANGAASQFLRYEIYQGPSSATRWGATGAERRSSASADTNPGIYDSTTRQGFTYRAVIDPTQATPPAGSYTDIITLDVSFTG